MTPELNYTIDQAAQILRMEPVVLNYFIKTGKMATFQNCYDETRISQSEMNKFRGEK